MKGLITCVLLLPAWCCLFIQPVMADMPQDSCRRPLVGLVLSGGGAKGFAHVGVLKVVDSLRIPVDFIVGTSMGSIVGGLYAMGYSAGEIETLIREQNWEYILTDKVSRKNIPLSVRDEYDRYTLSFPIRSKGGIKLPRGVVHGQNIINLFSRLAVVKDGVERIEDLPVKFACIATDVVGGGQVVIDSGNIAEAMRASMSIPYIFTPVDKGDMLLVDGGLRNNFPANVAKQMGADIVIGVDVQRGVKSKKEIRGGNDLIDQAVYFLGEDAYAESLKCVDIYIKPDIDNYGIGDFYSADSLIYYGLCGAREKMDMLVDLGEKTGGSPVAEKGRAFEKERFLVRHVTFTGLDKIPYERVSGRLTFRCPGYVSADQIQETVDRIYGTRCFETAWWQLQGGEKDTLNFILKENLLNTFNIGFHFDTWENASLLLNTTFRSNVARNGSRISLNLKLSQYPGFLGSYILDNGARPGLWLELDLNRIKFYDYEKGRKLKTVTAGLANFNVSTLSIIQDSYTIGAGVSVRHYNCDIDDHHVNSGYREKDFLLNYFAYVRMDTREKSNYAKSGVKITARLQKITENGWCFRGNPSLYSGYFEIIKPLGFGKFTFTPQIYLSGLFGKRNPAPVISHILVGGSVVVSSFVTHVPFIGVRPFEFIRHSAFVLRGDFRWEMWKRNYLMCKVNVLKTNSLLELKGYEPGVGIGYSYESIIGPVEALVTWSKVNHQFGGFVNIGYWF